MKMCNYSCSRRSRFKNKLMKVMVNFLPAKNKQQSATWISSDIIQGISIEHTKLSRQKYAIINCTYLNNHLLAAPREYVLHGLIAGLDWACFWSLSPSMNPVAMPNPVSCCLSQWVGFHTYRLPCYLGGFSLMYK